MAGFDHRTAGQAIGYPGIDPRQWVSNGTVVKETDDTLAVDYEGTDMGPLVNVVLHPSGAEVACRVAGHVAGANEGEWFPFVQGDEVIVVTPGGDEKGGCIIIGRLYNGVDKFPTSVAGVDTKKNNMAFRRMRTPFIFETQSTYMVRSATTKAFFALGKLGDWVLSSGDGHYVAVNADFITMQSNDNKFIIQMDMTGKAITLNADGAVMQLKAGGTDSVLLVPGRMLIGTSGGSPVGHAVTLEQVVVLLQGLLQTIGSLLPGPVIGATLAGTAIAMLSGAIAQAATLPVTPFLPAITAALTIPPDPLGIKPGAGVAGLLLG